MSAVVIVDHQPQWAAQFEQAARELRTACAPLDVQTEHMGSTAVRGLCAKPVLDILLGVDSLVDIERRVPVLAGLGYAYRPAYEAEVPERRYFVRPAGATARVHLHAVLRGGPLWQRHLQFRDLLRQDAGLRDSYAALKRELASRYAGDKAAYTQAKGPFIQAALAAALPRGVGQA